MLVSSLLGMCFSFQVIASDKLMPWVVYYGDQLPAKSFDPYDLIILDSANDLMARRLRDKGKTVLGYLSLGEVEQNRAWYAPVKSQGLLLMENRHWPGSFFVDVRDQRWVSRVIEQLIHDMLRRGFHGVFLDTLDNPAELERIDARQYAGMVQAAARLVLTIRRHYPEIKIMMNRAYEILPQVGHVLDMELGESVFADYNFETKLYGLVDTPTYRLQVKWLQAAARQFPSLKIYTLDYWQPEDAGGIARIYQEQRGNGFNPLVSTIALDQIIPMP